MGLVGKENHEEETKHEWKTIKPKQQDANKNEEEKLLLEDKQKEHTFDEDFEKDVEEITLLRGKNSGHRRTAPQCSAESKNDTNSIFNCPHCASELESQGLLDAHVKMHIKNILSCDICSQNFEKSLDLEMHNKTKHEVKNKEDWNCNDCPFQANIAAELINL